MTQKLDKLDKRLLFELDKNARQSYQQLAKKLGISKDTALYRTKRLEKQGIIKGYYTLIDFSTMGYFLVRVYLRLQNTNPEIEESLINDLVANKSTLTVYRTDGNWDIAVAYLVKNFSDYYHAWEEFTLKYRKYVLDSNVAILFEYIHRYRNYLVDKALHDSTEKTTGNAHKAELDFKDLAILKQISGNAKIPIVKLAENLNLSTSTALYKLKQLEKKNVILGYRTRIDFEKLGYDYYKVDLLIEDITKRAALRSLLQTQPGVIYEDIAVGGSDVEFDMEVEGYNKFYGLIQKLKKAFPIRSHTYYRARKIYKYLYMPEL